LVTKCQEGDWKGEGKNDPGIVLHDTLQSKIIAGICTIDITYSLSSRICIEGIIQSHSENENEA
jgi:hypothetical protein